MYYFYLLTLIFILLIFYQLRQLSLRDFPAFSAIKTNALEHEELLTLLDRFDYTHDNGVCHGFTLTWAQEAAQGLEWQFYNRLNLIKREKETLPDSLQLISEKIKLSRALSKKEQKRIEVKPFLEAVCLAQSPEDYPDFYAKTIQQSNIDTIYNMIRLNLSTKQSTVKSLVNLTSGAANPETLKKFLAQCNQCFTIKNQVVVVFSSEEHTVGFKKYADNTWLFMDINHLYEQSEQYPYQILTNEALCSQLYESLFETSDQLVFHCCFVATTGQKKLNQNLSSLSALYSVTHEHLQISNCRGFGILALAVQNDDIKTVRNILKIQNKSSVIDPAELENALFYAAACNRLAIIKLLIKIPAIDINMDCSGSDSALAVACRYGNTDIAQWLLNLPSIDVNKINSQGMTPLMFACRSSSTHLNPVLFEYLLAKGANLEMANNEGDTALDIAQKNDNEVALSAIAAYRAKTGYIPKADLSTQPPKAVREKSHGILRFLTPSFFNQTTSAEESSSEQSPQLPENLSI
jgi:ankyrin repeat protein